MSEVKEWNNNPRFMWVWDGKYEEKVKRFVIYIVPAAEANLPVIALRNGSAPSNSDGTTCIWEHCAEIEQE